MSKELITFQLLVDLSYVTELSILTPSKEIVDKGSIDINALIKYVKDTVPSQLTQINKDCLLKVIKNYISERLPMNNDVVITYYYENSSSDIIPKVEIKIPSRDKFVIVWQEYIDFE